jgi:antitoxin HicB
LTQLNKMKKQNKHRGSSFDDFLEEEGIFADVQAITIKRQLALELQKTMKDLELSKTKMAAKMHTSRAQLDRLLDPENESVTLSTLSKAATATGMKLSVSLQPI